MKSLLALFIACVTLIVVPLFGQSKKPSGQPPKPKITFVELGSVKCIPCRQMQPVMKAIEEKYADQVKVIFYDVWKDEQREYAEKYEIRLIPTQIFLDQNGRELMRHEGFFPEKEIDAFLQSKGLKPKSVVKG
jgi:thioredoxin 1